MSSDLMRRYIDILNENTQPQQLDEGMMDMIKGLVPKFMKLLGGDKIEQIAQQVKQVTGGDFTPSQENAVKVAQALGFEKILQDKQVAEGIAPTWQGKLVQLLYAAGMLGSFAAGYELYGTRGGAYMFIIGIILLMASQAVFGGERGQIGEPLPMQDFVVTNRRFPNGVKDIRAARSAKELLNQYKKDFPNIPPENWDIKPR